MSEGREQAWTCLVCGYVYVGVAPPDTCPVCAASSRAFESEEMAAAESEESEEPDDRPTVVDPAPPEMQ